MIATAKKTIAQLNDECRKTPANIIEGGRVTQRWVMTRGVSVLPQAQQLAITRAVIEYSDFTPDNDPHREHDMGFFEIDGTRLMWKIDYYDAAMDMGSDDPSDPDQTTRVLTIMLAGDY